MLTRFDTTVSCWKGWKFLAFAVVFLRKIHKSQKFKWVLCQISIVVKACNKINKKSNNSRHYKRKTYHGTGISHNRYREYQKRRLASDGRKVEGVTETVKIGVVVSFLQRVIEILHTNKCIYSLLHSWPIIELCEISTSLERALSNRFIFMWKNHLNPEIGRSR